MSPTRSPTHARLCHGQLKLDIERHEATFSGQRVQLTATEFQVLAALIERPGIVLSRAQLLQRAYADDLHVTERTLDSHVRRIRAKFRGLGGDPIATCTAWATKRATPEACAGFRWLSAFGAASVTFARGS